MIAIAINTVIASIAAQNSSKLTFQTCKKSRVINFFARYQSVLGSEVELVLTSVSFRKKFKN